MGHDEEGAIIIFLNKLLTFLPSHYGVEAFVQQNHLIDENHAGGQPSHRQASSSQCAAGASVTAGSLGGSILRKVTPDLYIVKKSDDSEALGYIAAAFRGRKGNHRRPLLILETTSTGREQGRDLYEKARIQEYVVIKCQRNRPHTPDRHYGPCGPCVVVFKLDRDNRYHGRTYKGDEEVKASFLEHWGLTAKQLFDYKAIRRVCDDEAQRYREMLPSIARREEERKDEGQKADRSQLKITKLTKK